MRDYNKHKDFKCDCGCGQKIRVVYLAWRNGYVIDLGFMKDKEKRPKIGIVLRSDGKLWDFVKSLPKKPRKKNKKTTQK